MQIMSLAYNVDIVSFLGAWSFLLVHIRFTPTEGTKGFVNYIFKKSENESRTMEKGHSSWSDFVVHGVNQPLDYPWVHLH